jgi:hypothetical protein
MDAPLQAIRDLNISPDLFNYLIFTVIGVGGLWAIVRLYSDLRRPIGDDEVFERPTLPLHKRD